MIDLGKRNLLGVLIDAVDYEGALRRLAAAARDGRPCAATALAVHGVMTGYTDDEHRARLNGLDLVVPDGQPVRWALNLLHRTRLPDRVYGPTLMLDVCRLAERERFGVYLYGNRPEVLEQLQARLRARFPGLRIVGAEPSKFRRLAEAERAAVIERIGNSGARFVLVGLGCPRQEVWAYEYREAIGVPILAVGAAFDFLAGTVPQAPHWMQGRGLEWLYRLKTDPFRLWRRYLLFNPWYSWLVAAQLLRLRRFPPQVAATPRLLSYG